MLFLLDTNAFSDLMRNQPSVEGRIAALGAGDRVAISTTVRGEILYGLKRLPVGRRRDELTQRAGALFAAIRCEPIPVGAADAYATIKLSRQQQGLSLDENDLWIAATAFSLNATLVTRDKDFRSLKEIDVVDWSA